MRDWDMDGCRNRSGMGDGLFDEERKYRSEDCNLHGDVV